MKEQKLPALLLALLLPVLLTACGAPPAAEEIIVAPTETTIPVQTTLPVPEETQPQTQPPSQARLRLKGMTLKEKIGQMVMVAARSWGENQSKSLTQEQTDAIRKLNLSGVCLFAQNIEDTAQTLRLTDQIQQAAFGSGAGVGALISIDQEGGYITRLTTGTDGIGNMAIAATGDKGVAYASAELIGQELAALGINVDFAPDADVNSNPNNPIIGVRSFSDDPQTVADYVGPFLEGLKSQGIAGCMKHFPGHGDTDTDSHTGLPLVDKSLTRLLESDLIPFAQNCKDAPMVMTAHIQFPQIETETYLSVSTGEPVHLPATMSRTIITGLLREKLGFEGVVVTDALEMGAIRNHFALYDAVAMVIRADVDLLLMPIELNSPENIQLLAQLIDEIARMVETGEIAEAEIDNSVERILTLKEKLGLFRQQEEDLEARIAQARTVVGSDAHHREEWKMACKAVTVYQNNGAFPLTREEKSGILYLTAQKNQLLSMDLARQKLEADDAGVRVTAWSYGADPDFNAVAGKLAQARVVILTTAAGALREADATDPANKKAIFCQRVLEEARHQGKKVIVISTGLPYDAPSYAGADAILLCYNPTGVTELPRKGTAETRHYGPNLSAALYTVLK